MRYLFRTLCTLAVTFSILAPSAPASSVSGSNWQAGRIIDDALFANGNDMSVADVQNFLNNLVPVCDTWGTQQATEYGSTLTHAQYAASRGWPGPPFVCLRDYYEAPKTTPGNWLPDNSYNHYDAGNKILLPVPGGVSAAQQIVNAARQYNISSRALLVKIATESRGPLTADNWPLQRQYTYAMGAHCPDSGPGGSANCDVNYSGFSIQISEAAKLLRYYLDNSTQAWWPYKKPFQVNTILWNVVETGCGSGDVFVQSVATAALYTYTPYQPNGAALANMYGTGDGCSAYGNRNFWRTWADWFGLPLTGAAPLPVSDVWLSAKEATVGQPITAAYTITNNMGSPITLPSVGFNTQMNGKRYDFGIATNVTIPAYSSKEIVGTFTPTTGGAYSIQGVYQFLQGWYGSVTLSWVNVHWPSLSLTSPIAINPEFPLLNAPATASFSIKNTGSLTAYIKYVMAANLDDATPSGYSAMTISLAPNQTYTYSSAKPLGSTRPQTAWVAYQVGDSWFRLGNNINYRAYSSPANIQLVSSVSTSPAYPSINSPVTATFKVRNLGDQPVRLSNLGLGAVRPSDGKRFDFTSQTGGIPGVISGGQELTYTASRAFPTKDAYTLFLTSSYDGVNFSGDNIVPASSSISSAASIQTYLSPANLQVTNPISSSQPGGPLSHIVDVSYTVKNVGDAPTGNIILAFYCRQNTTAYCDIPGRSVNLTNGESATLTSSLGYFSAGGLTFKPLKYQDGAWQDFDKPTYVSITNSPPPQNSFETTLSFDRTSTAPGQPITTTYTIKNTSSSDLQVPRYAVAARLDGAFYDYGLQDWFYLRAGETKTFASQFSSQKPGTYTLFPVLRTANETWYGYTPRQITIQ